MRIAEDLNRPDLVEPAMQIETAVSSHDTKCIYSTQASAIVMLASQRHPPEISYAELRACVGGGAMKEATIEKAMATIQNIIRSHPAPVISKSEHRSEAARAIQSAAAPPLSSSSASAPSSAAGPTPSPLPPPSLTPPASQLDSAPPPPTPVGPAGAATRARPSEPQPPPLQAAGGDAGGDGGGGGAACGPSPAKRAKVCAGGGGVVDSDLRGGFSDDHMGADAACGPMRGSSPSEPQVPDALVSFAAAPHYMLHYACVEVS